MDHTLILSSSSDEPAETPENSEESSGAMVTRSELEIGPDGRYAKKLTCFSRKSVAVDQPSKRARTSSSSDDMFEPLPGRHFDDIRNARACEFCRVVAELTPQQRLDVIAIGFGGLLEFQTIRLPHQMNKWLLKKFNPTSRYFKVSGKIRFCLTDVDGANVFGLNHSPGRFVVCDPTDSAVCAILRDWKRRFCVPKQLLLSLDDVASVMVSQRYGGDDFKRMFVLYAMNMVLTPECGPYITVGLLKSLTDVNGIKNLDWAEYVVSDLCAKILVHQKSAARTGSEGCLVLLQVKYFQSTMWKGIAPRSDRPWIKHWKESKLQERVMEEIIAGGFGQGFFLKMRCMMEEEVGPLSDQAMASSSSLAVTNVNGPISNWSDHQISQGIMDGNLRQVWDVLHGCEQFITSHAKKLQLETQSLRENCITVLGDRSVKFDARFGFDLVVNRLFSVCSSLNPDLCIAAKILNSSVNEIVEGSSHAEFEVRPWMKWVFNYPAIYDSGLLRKCSTLCHTFPQYKMEVSDFCVSDGDQREILFHDGGSVMVKRSDFLTLELKRSISHNIVTAFARVLNYEWMNRGMTSRVCFGVLTIESESQSDKVVANVWKEWLDLNGFQLNDACFVFIPVLVNGSYFLVLINFLDRKIQCIDTMNHDVGETLFEREGRVIGSAFSYLLQLVGDDVREVEFNDFAQEQITPHWTAQEVDSDGDGGICVMNIMENWAGSTLALERLRLNEVSKKIQLRVAYASFMTLSNLNTMRRTVLDRAGEFVAKKGGGVMHV